MRACQENIFLSSCFVIEITMCCICGISNNAAWNIAKEFDSLFYYGSTQPKRMSRAILNPTGQSSTIKEFYKSKQATTPDVLFNTVNIDPITWDPKLCSNKSGQPPSSFLWRISTSPPSYLFGTLHVAYIHVWPQVASIVKETFRKADHVYFELDLTNPHTLEELRKCQMLPSNTQLTDLLPDNLVERVQMYFARFKQLLDQWIRHDRLGYSRVLYETIIKDWRRKRPIWILLLLNSLTRGEFSDRGVPVLDLYLAQEARKMGKKRGAVEQVEDQCRPLNEVRNDQVAMALEMTLDSLESTNQPALASRKEAVKPPSPPLSQSRGPWPAPPVSDRENPAVETRRIIDSLSGSNHQHHSLTRDRTNIQPNGTRHREWFMHPVQQLVQQYNCGDLAPVLRGASMSQAASMTASNTVANKSFAQNSSRIPRTGPNQLSQKISDYEPNATLDGNINVEPNSTPLMLELENYLNRELIIKRNARMARQIMETLKMVKTRNESAFFALGAAHFVGEPDTIIDHLKRAGYRVTPISRNFTETRLDLKTETKIHEQKQNEKYISRNRRKHTEDKEFISEYDVPEFRPRYVKFENNWIRIEDFKLNTYPNRKQQTVLHGTSQKVREQVENSSRNIAQTSSGFETQKPLIPKLLRNVSKGGTVTVKTTWILSTLIYVLSIIYFRLFLYFI